MQCNAILVFGYGHRTQQKASGAEKVHNNNNDVNVLGAWGLRWYLHVCHAVVEPTEQSVGRIHDRIGARINSAHCPVQSHRQKDVCKGCVGVAEAVVRA